MIAGSLRSTVLAAVMALPYVFAVDAPAAAMTMVEQFPKVNEIVDGSAVAFALRFDEPLDHSRSGVVLMTPSGSRPLKARLNAQPNTLYVAAGRLGPGDYQLHWKAVSRRGEMQSGVFPFTVAGP